MGWVVLSELVEYKTNNIKQTKKRIDFQTFSRTESTELLLKRVSVMDMLWKVKVHVLMMSNFWIFNLHSSFSSSCFMAGAPGERNLHFDCWRTRNGLNLIARLHRQAVDNKGTLRWWDWKIDFVPFLCYLFKYRHLVIQNSDFGIHRKSGLYDRIVL